MVLNLTEGQKAVVVLWSKDFGPFLHNREAFIEWPLFFHFTINSPDQILEPDLPPLDQRLGQLRQIVALYGIKAVRWRFDPVVHYRLSGSLHSNLSAFTQIAYRVAELGIRDVTVSFMDSYRKIARRERKLTEPLEFVYPAEDDLIEAIREPAEQLADMGFAIHTCCEPALAASRLPAVSKGRCIDADLLSEISNLDLPAEPDRGQRYTAGCGCHKSIDIGCYAHHRCRGSCLYCYARP
jgi:hypothetical protein